MRYIVVVVGFVLASISDAHAQSIECTFLSKKDARPLYRWTIKLGPKPFAHKWHTPTSYTKGEDKERQITYVKHAKATNTAVVAIKQTYEGPSSFTETNPDKLDFDDQIVFIDFAKNRMSITEATQATSEVNDEVPVNLYSYIAVADSCKRLD